MPAIGLTADHVAFARKQTGSLADDLDDVIHGRLGGAVAFAPVRVDLDEFAGWLALCERAAPGYDG